MLVATAVKRQRPLVSFHSTPTHFVGQPSYVDVGLGELHSIKQKRFAAKLGEFKQMFEQPVLDTYNAIYNLKRTLANRQARAMMRNTQKGRKAKPPTKLERLAEINRKELAIEMELQEGIRGATLPRRPLDGHTREQRQNREDFVRRTFDLLERDEQEPHEWKVPHEMVGWQLEHKMKDVDLGKRVAQELGERGFTLHWDEFVNRCAKRHENDAYSFWEHTSALGRTFKGREGKWVRPDVDPERPAVLLSPPRKKLALKRTKISGVSDLYPIGFETVHHANPIYEPYKYRKVIMYVKLAKLGLPPLVRTRLLQIAGDLYNPGKDLLIFPCSRRRTAQENRKWSVDALRKLLVEAWKVDLSFVPVYDSLLLPHEQIEAEIRRKPAQQAAQAIASFDGILEEPNFTVFRFPLHYDLEETNAKRHEVEKLTRDNFE